MKWKNPLPEVDNHADLQCMEEVGLWKVAHDAGNMFQYVESTVVLAMVPVLDLTGFVGQ
jgi:hypothetical protein